MSTHDLCCCLASVLPFLGPAVPFLSAPHLKLSSFFAAELDSQLLLFPLEAATPPPILWGPLSLRLLSSSR